MTYVRQLRALAASGTRYQATEPPKFWLLFVPMHSANSGQLSVHTLSVCPFGRTRPQAMYYVA